MDTPAAMRPRTRSPEQQTARTFIRGHTVFVGGLPRAASVADVVDGLGCYGPLTDVQLGANVRSGRVGYSFATFEFARSAAAAVDNNDVNYILNTWVDVQFFRAK